MGAILTQNTNWGNVEKVINELKRRSLLTPQSLYRLPPKKLAQLIRPVGYFNIKSKRLRAFLDFLFLKYQGNLKKLFKVKLDILRQEFLAINGIGYETCDAILLYAIGKPIFVVDAYTKRIFLRHNLVTEKANYGEIQKLFMDNLPQNVKLFNEFHALLVKVGKEFCLKRKPKCKICPLGKFL